MRTYSEDALAYSIVVPFYNERSSARELYERIVKAMDAIGEPYEMVFVDDGSRDGTGLVLADVAEGDSRVSVVTLRRNFGQTAALKAGFDYARGEVIVAMDGDLQHDPAEIPLLLEKIDEGYDIASGWRAERTDGRWSRRLPSRIANALMARLSRLAIHDFGTTFKAYRREVIKDVGLYGELHRFIPALAMVSGATVAEVPITNNPRAHGTSNYGISRTFRVALDLLVVKFLLDYSTRPLHFFGRLAFAAMTAGSAIGLFLMTQKIVFGIHVAVDHEPLILLAMLLGVAGVQFLSIGLVGELVSRTYYESQGKPIYAVRRVVTSRFAPNWDELGLRRETARPR